MNTDNSTPDKDTHLPARASASTPPKTPRWVKAFVVVAIILVVLVGVMLLSGGEHGPGRHMLPPSTTDVHTPPMDHSGQ